jgi:hypothetical protein
LGFLVSQLNNFTLAPVSDRCDLPAARIRRQRDARAFRERMRACDRGAQAERLAHGVLERAAQVPQFGGGARDGRMRGGLELDDRGVGLCRGAQGQRCGEDREHLVDAVGQRPCTGVEQHHLLLDADGPRPPGGHVVPSRPGRELGAANGPASRWALRH